MNTSQRATLSRMERKFEQARLNAKRFCTGPNTRKQLRRIIKWARAMSLVGEKAINYAYKNIRD